ncbi:hypothetical protein [Variovorax sp.]|nr:hypothetical protein [Variovorax sp.]HYP84953.1 hypothetical protein [Variovorax sp.]
MPLPPKPKKPAVKPSLPLDKLRPPKNPMEPFPPRRVWGTKPTPE